MVPIARDHRYLLRNGDHVTTVFLDRPPGEIEADTVLADNVGRGAQRARSTCSRTGTTRIAFLADDGDLFTARERLAGHRAALDAAGVGRRTPRSCARATATRPRPSSPWTRCSHCPPAERPTAILAANNRNTVGAVRALARHGEPIALVGFDDFELADVLGITVMRSDPR